MFPSRDLPLPESHASEPEAAAVKVQSHVRGHLLRRRLTTKRKHTEAADRGEILPEPKTCGVTEASTEESTEVMNGKESSPNAGPTDAAHQGTPSDGCAASSSRRASTALIHARCTSPNHLLRSFVASFLGLTCRSLAPRHTVFFWFFWYCPPGHRPHPSHDARPLPKP